MLLLAAIALIAVGSALYVKHHQSNAPGDTKVHAGPATDSAQKATATNPSASAKAATNGSSQVATPDHPVSSTLAKPIGPNDNTGRVSLSGATGMESTCRSVPGATCYIQATKGSTTITVSGTKTIGSDPSNDGVVLDWDANKLSVGTWSIRAVASKDGSSASSDPQSLEVTQ